MNPFVSATSLNQTLQAIEDKIDGHIGVAVLDTESGDTWAYRGNERFPMLSTFKTLACAKMFSDADSQYLQLGEFVEVNSDEIIVWSPVTEKLIGKTISMQDACSATMLMSDNTAANIVLQRIGGREH